LNTIEKLGVEKTNRDIGLLEHRLIESYKFGYGSRMELGDPAFDNGIYQTERNITRPSFVKDYVLPRYNEDHTNADPRRYLLHEHHDEAHDKGTAHVSVLTRDMAVSVTSTVNLEWGCGYLDGKTGIVLNNEMDDYSTPYQNNSFGLVPSPRNYIEPGKRPLSSSTPVIVRKNGKTVLVIGAAGGSRIITATAQAMVDILGRKMKPDEAIHRCRLHHQLFPDWVSCFVAPLNR